MSHYIRFEGFGLPDDERSLFEPASPEDELARLKLIPEAHRSDWELGRIQDLCRMQNEMHEKLSRYTEK